MTHDGSHPVSLLLYGIGIIDFGDGDVRTFTNGSYISKSYSLNFANTQYTNISLASVRSIRSSSDGSKLIACDSSNIYISLNGGSSWSVNTAVTGKTWRRVIISQDGSVLFAVANNDYIYKFVHEDFKLDLIKNILNKLETINSSFNINTLDKNECYYFNLKENGWKIIKTDA
jgi:hypothetical protein